MCLDPSEMHFLQGLTVLQGLTACGAFSVSLTALLTFKVNSTATCIYVVLIKLLPYVLCQFGSEGFERNMVEFRGLF